MLRPPRLFSAGVLVAAAVLAAAAGCAPAVRSVAAASSAARSMAGAGRTAAALQHVLDSVTRTARYPGVSVGIAFADGSSIGIASGMSDTARRIRMTPEHLLLQGSVGKTYASAVALQLAAEGRLDLDAKISRWLGAEPWFARLPNAAAITVRQLMNHTSGLVRYEFKEQFTRDLTADPDRHWQPEELIAYLLGETPPFAAGQGWEYSDTNYIVLGMIIERITGSTYYDEMRRRLLVPLGLRSTVPSSSREIRGLSQGYAGANNPFGGTDPMVDAQGRFAINPQFEWTGGGVASTAEDLARWGQALYAGQVLTDALRAELLKGVAAPLGPQGTQYGLGVIMRPAGTSGPTWGHSGFFPGYVTEMMHFPDRGVTVAAMLNTSAQGSARPSPGQVIMAMMRALER